MRSWDWVRRKTFNPVPFYKRSWEILRQDPWVFVWKLIADLISRMGTLAVVTFVVSLVIVDLQQALSQGQGLFSWLARMAEISRSPGFLAGFAGVVAFTTLLGTAIQAYVVSGIWGMIAHGLRGEPVERWRTFASQTWVHFPHVLGLFLLKLAVRTVTILFAVALVIAFFRASSTGSFGYLSGFQQTLVLAGSAAFLIGWFAMTRLTLEAVGAPLTIDEMPLGEALLDGAAFVVENFWAMYRLLLFSLALLLIPMAGYWFFIMAQNILLMSGPLALLAPLVRLVADLFLWFSLSVLGVLFYGAIFAFYRKDDEAVAEDRRRETAELEAANFLSEEPPSPAPGTAPTDPSSPSDLPREPGLRLRAFLPAESPFRTSISDLLGEPQDQASDEEE